MALKKPLDLIKKFYQNTQSTSTKTAKHGNKIFIHVPRTGGKTILKTLKFHDLDVYRECQFNHDPFFKLQRLNKWDEDAYIFAFVRNPFTRTYSYYNHYLNHNKNISFSQFLKNIKSKIKSKNTPYYYYPQSFFLYNEYGEMTLSKIFKYEEYDKSLTQIKKIYKKDFSFGHENKTSWSRDDFLKDYNKENIELVRELFSVDFMNFNYDMKGHDIF
jgi:hypothetical protein